MFSPYYYGHQRVFFAEKFWTAGEAGAYRRQDAEIPDYFKDSIAAKGKACIS